MTIKIKARNVKPTSAQVAQYRTWAGSMCIRNTNLRFGKLVVLSDQDLDG
jgi:hypothetical protein